MPTYTAKRYVPTGARTGNESSALTTVFRGENLFIRGRGDDTYSEVYGGSLPLDSAIPTAVLTGTLAYSPSSKVITGTATLFLDELHPGQRLLSSLGDIFVVEEIASNTSFTSARLPTNTTASTTADRLPVLFEIDKKRGTLLSGNALEFDLGTILCVGSGTLRINGTVLSGTSLVASRYAKVAIYREATNDYIVQQLGFDAEPFGITAANSAAAPTSFTYIAADVNTGTENVNHVAHGLLTGQKVMLTTAGTLISIDGTAWNTLDPIWVIRIDADNFKFATSLQNAVATTAANITSAGAGTTTVTTISKAMPAGDRSIRVAKASSKLGVPSFGNPGEKIKVAVTAGGRIAITFPAMDSNVSSADPHDAWRIYGSLFGGSTTQATANADSGPWYYIRTVETGEVPVSGGTFYLEYLDAEIEAAARLITFDNDAPSQAEYVGTVAGYPVLVSCQGKPTTAIPAGASPGPSIIPFKPANLAAAPLVFDSGQRNEVPLSPPETIVGFYMAAGRLYLMTANTLQIAIFTADLDFPVATRPFWKSGFRNPYALCFVNGRLYGFTSAGAMRSVTDGEEGSEEHSFAADVEELMKDWDAENVFVVHDPQNECVCFVNSGARQSATGFWESEVIPFMLRSESWSHKIVFRGAEQDQIISGAATINGHFEFIIGGHDEVNVLSMAAYRFDTTYPGVTSVTYRQAWQFSDGGNEKRLKKIKNPRVTGLLHSATIGIHGAEPGEDISADDLESGNANSKSGAIALTNSSEVNYRPSEDVVVSGLGVYTLCVEGTWPGTGEKDRIDEVAVETVIRSGRK